MNTIVQSLLRDLRITYRTFLDPLHDRANGVDFTELDARIGLNFERDYDEAFAIWAGLGYLLDLFGPRGTGTLHSRPNVSIMRRMCEREAAHIERLRDPDRAFAAGFWHNLADKLGDPDYTDTLPEYYGRD